MEMGILTTVNNSPSGEHPAGDLQGRLKEDLQEVIGEAVSLDRLAGSWMIHQLVKGHRFSTDDLMTAWIAAQEVVGKTGVLEQVDLGAGIGSVGLLTQWRLDQLAPAASWRLTMVEAQEVSHRLARATVQYNDLGQRITTLHGDLRTTPVSGRFPLVTGSPPYIPLGKGIASSHPQKAACRMELRGSIADYAVAAERWLAEDGTFVVCFAGQDVRGERAIADAGLVLHRRLDVFFRAHLPPTICILVARRSACAHPVRESFTIRDHQGIWTPEYLSMRVEMGADPATLTRTSSHSTPS